MADFYGQILGEDPLPPHLTPKQRQLLGEHTTAPLIWGEGNPAAPIFVILDNPGARMTKEGKPFLCGSRITLQQGASEAGLDLSWIYVSYLLKARPLKKYDRDRARGIALPHLNSQVKEHQPQTVFCLGTVAVQAYFNEPDISVKQMRQRCFRINGFKTIVSYHPLAVRRNSLLYRDFLQDWSLVRAQLVETPPRPDPAPDGAGR